MGGIYYLQIHLFVQHVQPNFVFCVVCPCSIMPKQYSAFKALMSKKGQVDMLISALTNLLAGPVWINERHICTALASVSKRFHKRPTISVLFH